MRVLFTFVGGRGHFEPLVPIACAAEAAGHCVAFGCASSMISDVAAAGFTAFAVGPGANAPREWLAIRRVDREREDRHLRDRFVRRAARYRAPRIIALCREWQPSVLVCDETDFGAVVAAERLGLPFATVLVIAAGSFVRPEVVGESLNELRAEHGLPPDPELQMLSRYLVLSTAPRSYRCPAYPLPDTAHVFRPSILGAAREPPPAWSSTLPGAATVYFTLGTIFPLESGDLFARVLMGLRELPINVLATLGPDADPEELGPQPANVHIERYVPQSSVLPYCTMVVSHGGSGSVIGALAHGLPSVLIPIGADQPLNAERCADLGVAQLLDAVEATPEAIRAAVVGVLEEPTYRRNAERLRDEIAALPELAQAVGLLERLAVERRPLYSTCRANERS